MVPVRCLLVLFLLSVGCFAKERFPGLPAYLYEGTYRIVWEHTVLEEPPEGSPEDAPKKSTTYLLYGTCFGIDLSKYGCRGKRGLLTAYHVLDDEGFLAQKVTVYVQNGEEIKRIGAKVIARDEKNDIALLEADEDLPATKKLACQDNLRRGSALFLATYPEESLVTPVAGHLTAKRIRDEKRPLWQASMSIENGYSGSPVIDPNRDEIVGLVIEAYFDGKMSPNACLFVPWGIIDKFLAGSANKIKK